MKKRKELGLTQRQIAETIGVTVQTVSNWENGLYSPKLTLEQVDRLCQILQSDIKEVKKMFAS